MVKIDPSDLTEGQQEGLAQLCAIEQADPAALEIVDIDVPRSGFLPVLVSLATADAAAAYDGPATGARAEIRAREQFIVYIPGGFPFRLPTVHTPHTRFAGLPHVQWGRSLCLYISPTTEWQPADGMFGFMERLLLWVARAAAGALDASGEPVHPPVTYTKINAGVVVVRANCPSVSETLWTGFAVLHEVSPMRTDVVGWLDVAGAARLIAEPEVVSHEFGPSVDPESIRLGLAVLLSRATPFEFPAQVKTLLQILEGAAVGKQVLIGWFGILAHANHLLVRESAVTRSDAQADSQLYVLVGSPMRSRGGDERKQHLVAWHLPQLGRDAIDLLRSRFSDNPRIAEIGEQGAELVSRWLDAAELEWSRVYEERPEVTTRRDQGSPLDIVRAKKVLLLGCGTIGGRAAEHLVRAGVTEIVIVDDGDVSPGILVRQPYDDADIGHPKVDALAYRLRRIRPDVGIEPRKADALQAVLGDGITAPDVDLIVDATASPAVAALLERRRRVWTDKRPTIVSMLLGHTAQRGIVTLATPGYSGAGVDVLRKVKVSCLTDPTLTPFADDFFPDPPRTDYFQSEPGCSEATFVGSDAEVTALSATLLVRACATWGAMAESSDAGAALVDLSMESSHRAVDRQLQWRADRFQRDEASLHEVRVAPAALAEMRAECHLMARRRGPNVETGGVLLGEVDDACGVVWVSVASRPPPDSHASAHAFVCGTEGVEDLVERQDKATRGALRFVGLWHNHPRGQAAPSDIDEGGMRDLLIPVAKAPRRALLLIIGAPATRWSAWLEERDPHDGAVLPDLYARLRERSVGAERDTADDNLHGQALALAGATETRRWSPPRATGWRWWPWSWRL